MARYRKVSPRMWDDEKFRSLDHDAQLVWCYLLTGPEVTALPGLVRLSFATLSDAVQMPSERLMAAFAKISASGMAQADWPRRVVYLPHACEHNPPESPNVIKAWRKLMDDIPSCKLKAQGFQRLKDYTGNLPEAFREAFGRVFDSFAKDFYIATFANQEQEQEQEQDLSGDESSTHHLPVSGPTPSSTPTTSTEIDPSPAPKAKSRRLETPPESHWSWALSREWLAALEVAPREAERALPVWVDAFCKLERLDKHPAADIARLVRWIVQDEGEGQWTGWRRNCQSPLKLRKQNRDGRSYYAAIWDRMEAQEQAATRKRVPDLGRIPDWLERP